MPWEFLGPDHTDTVAFLRSFCVDYTTWNDTAHAASKDQTGEHQRAAMEEASNAYAHFLTPFIAPETQLQPIAFGSDSAFDPSRLDVAAIEDLPNGWNVRFSIKHAFFPWGNDFIAEVERLADGKLALKQVWYLDPFPEDVQERFPYI